MQYAVGFSMLLVVLVVNVPFLQPIFNTHFLTSTEWGVVIGLALIPAISEEITKFFLSRPFPATQIYRYRAWTLCLLLSAKQNLHPRLNPVKKRNPLFGAR